MSFWSVELSVLSVQETIESWNEWKICGTVYPLLKKKKNKEKPEVQPKNKNTSDCKLYQNIAYATSKLYRTRVKVKKKKKDWQKQNIQLKALTFQKKNW